jgi:hypothetical protein
MKTFIAKITDVTSGKVTHQTKSEFSGVDSVLAWAHKQGVVGHSVLRSVTKGFHILQNDQNEARCRLDIQVA